MDDLHDEIAYLQRVSRKPRLMLNIYMENGQKIVGCFPPYAPEELVYASGLLPMGMWGGYTELKLAKSYLPPFACPIMQANMEFALNGKYSGLQAVIIPAICDTLRCMTQNWRFGVPRIPMIPIVYPQNRTSAASVDYLISEYEHVLVMLSTITGKMMTEKALCRTIELYNEHNAVMREFSALAAKHLDIITPTVRHGIMKSAFFMDKAEHTASVKKINAGLKALPEHKFSGKKVILSGISSEPKELLEILEENGIAVVGDDLAQESRQYRTDTPLSGGGALKRLALQWQKRTCCSLIHELGQPRGTYLSELCRERQADGVINCLMKFCDPEEYDQPWLEADLRQAGYPCLTIEVDPLNKSFEQLRTRIQTFAEML
mgnify:FL=1